MKDLISEETIFEEFVEQMEWNPEEITVQNLFTPAQIVSKV